MIRHLRMILTLAGILACASSSTPPPETVTRVDVSTAAGNLVGAQLHLDAGKAIQTVPVRPDSVWQVLPRVYEMLGIPDAGAVPEQRVFGARNFRPGRIDRKRLSTYIDCGTGPTATPKADEHEITMSLTSRLTPAEDGETVVETVLEASAKPRVSTGNRVSCQSNGTLEARVGELLLWFLVSAR